MRAITIDSKAIRDRSRYQASQLGCRVLSSLPLIDNPVTIRPQGEVWIRLLCMHAIAAVAYGFRRSLAKAWLESEGIVEALTKEEAEFLTLGNGNDRRFQMRVEGMWALGWTVGLVPELDFSKPCADDFCEMLPDLVIGEPSSLYGAKLSPRPAIEVVEACDLSYCLHWCLTDAALRGHPLPPGIQPEDLIERRHALEWVISEGEYEDVSLDT